jgi:hypothetical protein
VEAGTNFLVLPSISVLVLMVPSSLLVLITPSTTTFPQVTLGLDGVVTESESPSISSEDLGLFPAMDRSTDSKMVPGRLSLVLLLILASELTILLTASEATETSGSGHTLPVLGPMLATVALTMSPLVPMVSLGLPLLPIASGDNHPNVGLTCQEEPPILVSVLMVAFTSLVKIKPLEVLEFGDGNIVLKLGSRSLNSRVPLELLLMDKVTLGLLTKAT